MDSVFTASFSPASALLSRPALAHDNTFSFSYLCLCSIRGRRLKNTPLFSDDQYLKIPRLKGVTASDLSMRASELSEVSLQEDFSRRQSLKQLIIFDLNGVLVRAYPREQAINITKKPSMYLKYKKIYFRPGLSTFIDKCLESFEIGIWSCFQMNNIKPILRKSIGQNRMDKLLFIWDQSWCSMEGHVTNLQGQTKPALLKDLSKVWETYPQYGPKNTLLIDDSEYKLKNNPRCKCVCLESYDPDDEEKDQSSIFLWNSIMQHIHIYNDVEELTSVY